MHILAKRHTTDLFYNEPGKRHSPVGVSCDCPRLVDLCRFVLSQCLLQTAYVVCICHHQINISLLKSSIMVHQVQHCNWRIIRQIRQKSLWKIAADIRIQFNLSLLIQLHHTNPDQKFCRRSPLKYGILRSCYLILHINITVIFFHELICTIKNSDCHSGRCILMFGDILVNLFFQLHSLHTRW